MKRGGTTLRRGRGEHGQVLILAVVALVLVILAVLLLFDVQTVIRGKIKGQNAVDAAALTGAEWQRHSLNLIGELNLVRATGTLISNPFFEDAVMETYEHADEVFYSEDSPIRNRSDAFLSFPDLESLVVRNRNNVVIGMRLGLLRQEVRRVEKERFYLDTLDRLVSQLQSRISFVGPLIGFGAAQQAAKKNGISSDSESCELLIMYANQVGGRQEDNVYERFAPETINDYTWRAPYIEMLRTLLDYDGQRARGVAAGTRFRFTGMPNLVADPPSAFTSLLGDKSFYESILGRNWCELDRYLYLDYSGNWWSSFQCDYESAFIRQSEILPLHITFSYFSPEDSNLREPYSKPTEPFYGAEGYLDRYIRSDEQILTKTYRDNTNPYEHGYDYKYEEMPDSTDGKKKIRVTLDNSPFSPFPGERTDDSEELTDLEIINSWDTSYFTPEQARLFLDTFLNTYNEGDSDRRYTPIPVFSWAVFDYKWNPIRDEMKREWEGDYLRGRFKEGMDYHSGAVSFFETQQRTVTKLGSMGPYRNDSDDIGRVFSNNGGNQDSEGVSHALSNIDRSVDKIRTSSSAKPVGTIKTKNGTAHPFAAGRMVLPVFTKTTLVPISLDPPEGISMLDLDWYYYLTEFVPLLSGSPTLEDAWNRAEDLARNDSKYRAHLGYYRKYYNALSRINDPKFRQTGINWLNAPVNRERSVTNRDIYCSGEGESTPALLH